VEDKSASDHVNMEIVVGHAENDKKENEAM
jgi:hypothetical protein